MELKYNHYVEVLECMNTNWLISILNTIKHTNIKINNIKYIPYYIDTNNKLNNNDDIYKIVYNFKVKAYHMKVCIPIFLYGVRYILTDTSLIHILEYLIGSGPLVYKLIVRYVHKMH